MFDFVKFAAQLVKYLFEGGLVAALIPGKFVVNNRVMTALIIAAVFVVTDMYFPSLAISIRTGAGFGIGANLAGFPQVG